MSIFALEMTVLLSEIQSLNGLQFCFAHSKSNVSDITSDNSTDKHSDLTVLTEFDYSMDSEND